MSNLLSLLAKDKELKTSHNYRRLSWAFNYGLVVNGADSNRLYLYEYRTIVPLKPGKANVSIVYQWNPTLEDIIANDWEAL